MPHCGLAWLDNDLTNVKTCQRISQCEVGGALSEILVSQVKRDYGDKWCYFGEDLFYVHVWVITCMGTMCMSGAHRAQKHECQI